MRETSEGGSLFVRAGNRCEGVACPSTDGWERQMWSLASIIAFVCFSCVAVTSEVTVTVVPVGNAGYIGDMAGQAAG